MSAEPVLPGVAVTGGNQRHISTAFIEPSLELVPPLLRLLAQAVSIDGELRLVASIVAPEKPLRHQTRLDDVTASRADWQPVTVLSVALVQASSVQLGAHQLLGGIPVNTVEGLVETLNIALVVKDVDHRKVMPLCNLVVYQAVGRRQLEDASAEFRLHRGVSKDGHHLSGEGVECPFANQVTVTTVIWVDAKSDITCIEIQIRSASI